MPAALSAIRRARELAASTKDLLRQAGDRNEKRCLSTRLKMILDQPVGTNLELDQCREKLCSLAKELKLHLSLEFRHPPASLPSLVDSP